MGIAGFSGHERTGLPGGRSRRLWLLAVPVATLLMLALLSGLGVSLLGCDKKPASRSVAQRAGTVPRSRTESSWRLESESTISVIPATTVDVIDGATAVFRMADGTKEEVRLIGIYAPELRHQRSIYGAESAKRAAVLLGNQSHVFLEQGLEERDGYGRLLAYVWTTEPPARPSAADVRSTMLNAKMLISGYAKLDTGEPNTRYAELFGVFLAEARTEKRGLWDPKLIKVAGPDSEWTEATAAESAAGTLAYVGNARSKKFHVTTCKNAQKMKPANRVPLESREAAIAGGYVPCKICKP